MTTSAPGWDAALQEAARYLEGIGFRILDRDWRRLDGGLDIVAVDRHTFVVCVLKVSSGTRYRTPLELLSRAKRNLLRSLAIRWLNAHGMRFDQVRADVIGVIWGGSGGFTIEHIRGVA
jgi:putative endonuclease